MFRKTKKQIEDLSRKVKALDKDNYKLFSHIRELERDISNLREYRELDRRVLYCHDCQRYPATDELAIMDASVAAVIEYAQKRAMEESDGDIEKYFIAFDYHCKDIAKHIYERTEGSNP